MRYYNENEMPNHKELQINYLNRPKKNYRIIKHKSTDNIFETYRGYTLHTIYNNFLVNPYLIRNSRYKNIFNENTERNIRIKKRYFNSNFNYLMNNNNEEEKKDYIKKNSNKYNISINDNNEYEYNEPEKMLFPQIENKNINNGNNINIRKRIINNYQNYIKNETIPSSNKEKIIMQRPIEYNIKNKGESIDSSFTNNNKLYLSYDLGKKKYLNRSVDNDYISPVIAKIAKHNYLMKNPYSDKNEYLGPSMLKNNPILYPISTYKFDFKRYINNYHVNKFV